MREYRVTENVSEKDIGKIFDNLKEYNLSKLECSEIVPLGVFVEDADGKKQVFELTEYPKTGKRHYFTKEL